MMQYYAKLHTAFLAIFQRAPAPRQNPGPATRLTLTENDQSIPA
jgi:hypothetical protein